MAIITTSALVSNISGSINGSTFQRGNGGLIMRNKPSVIGSKTLNQNPQRLNLAYLTTVWEGFTDAQRKTWQDYANFINGVGITNRNNRSGSSGKNQFIAINSWLLIYNKPILDAPTFLAPLAPISPYYNSAFESDDLGKTVGALDTASCILVTQVSLATSASTYKTNKGYRTLVYPQVDGTTQNWYAQYKNYYGVNCVSGKKYWVLLKVVNFLTGQISSDSEALILYTGSPSYGIGTMIVGSTNIVG